MILYNGATGGIGRHLGPHLVSGGVPHRLLRTRIELADGLSDELSGEVDLKPGASVALIHLAAMVSVPACEADPETAWAVNVTGATRYVHAFLDWSQRCRYRPAVVYVSTGHVYAPPMPGVPLAESAPLGPRSVYATTKLAGENTLAELAASFDASLTAARVFGLLAPGQPPHYLLPALIDRVRRRDLGGIPGLSNVRDYLDARDVVGHLHDLAEWSLRRGDGDATAVNVCSGVGMRIGGVLDVVIDAMLGDTAEADATRRAVSEAPARPTDVAWLVGSPQRLIGLTGRPAQSIDLATTVRDAIATS